MRTVRKTARPDEQIERGTFLGCPLTRNRTPWCFRLCPPDPEGRGRCGRVAPHSLSSNVQECIKEFKQRQVDSPARR